MLTKDIGVNSVTFRREGFKKFTEVNMSRRYFKNCIFLILIASMSVAFYTVFLSAKKSIKKSGGWKGIVQNMAMGPGDINLDLNLHDTNKAQNPIDSGNDRDKHRESGGDWLKHRLADRFNRRWQDQAKFEDHNNEPDKDENSNNNDRDKDRERGGDWLKHRLADRFNRRWQDQAKFEDHDNEPDKEEEQNDDFDDADAIDEREGEDLLSDGDEIDSGDDNFDNDHREAPEINENIDNRERIRDNNDVVPGKPVAPDLDKEEYKVRDKNGNFVGYKLFKFGIDPDMNKPEAERIRDLRRRLGLPPVPDNVAPKPVIEEPVQAPKKRAKIIDLEKAREEAGSIVDNLGAFAHRDKDGLLKDVPRNGILDNRLNDRFVNAKQGQAADDWPLLQRGLFKGNDDKVFPGRIAPRVNINNEDAHPANNNKGQWNDPNDIGFRSSLKKHVVARPFGNNGMNPFLDPDFNNNNKDDDFGPRDQGNPFGGHHRVARPFGNHGINPFLQGRDQQVDTNRDNILNAGQDGNRDADNNDKYARYRQEKENARRNAQINNNGLDPFQSMREHDQNNVMPNAAMGNSRLNQFDNKVYGRERFPQNANVDNNRMQPFAQNQQDNQQGFLQNGAMNDRRTSPVQINGNGITSRIAPRDSMMGNNDNSQIRENPLPQHRPDDLLKLNNDDGTQIRENPSQLGKRDSRNSILQHRLLNRNIHNGNQREVKVNDLRDPNDQPANGNSINEDFFQNPVNEEEQPEEHVQLKIENLNEPLSDDLDCYPFYFPPKEGTLCAHGSDHDRAMSAIVKKSGVWEPDMLAEFYSILKSDSDLGVVDIGAGIGVYTLTAAIMGRKVVAVEPEEHNYRHLHKSALENEISSKITLVAHAIGNGTYKARLRYDDESGGYSQAKIVKIPEGEMTADGDPDVVQVITLNNLVQALPFQTAVLKIDVGGYMEDDVLKKSSEFFKALDVKYIITHWNFHSGITTKIGLVTQMTRLGFRPRTHWDGDVINPETLKSDSHFLIWKR